VTSKKNCWEVMNCGRGPDGQYEHEPGACPTASRTEFNGVNNGLNGGRVCWAVAGTFCNGNIQGVFATKIESCLRCAFFRQVAAEEDLDFILRPEEEISAVKRS